MTAQNIKASVLHKQFDLQVESRKLSDPLAEEVQVEVKCTTLCGSDVHYYKHGANGDFKVREPLSLGHEASGIVTAVGSNVSSLQVGDKVALEVGQPCGECKLCRGGKYNLCTDMKFRSSAKSFPHFQGTLQERINCPASWCYKLPDNVPIEYGALVEPLAVALHAGDRAKVFPGASVLVIGAGAIGLFSAAVAKISGATTIAIADIAKNRVDFAVKHGFATHGYVVPMKRGTTTEEKLAISKQAAEAASALPRGNGDSEPLGLFDFTFECTGVESCVQTALYATASGGKVVFVGMGSPLQTLHIGPALLREVDLVGVFRYANNYATGIKLMAAGAIPALDKFITHKVEGLENVDKAFGLAGRPEDDNGNLVIKVAVVN
jgi:L-iditol 2-dehydrogenase